MKFHVTLGYKKKLIEVVYPYVIRSVITRAFNLPISNFNIQKWNDEWHDWVDVEPPELIDGDRLNLVINPPELVMGLSPGASGVIGHSPAAQCTSPMVTTPIVTSNNFISNSSMVTNSSIMVNSPMVTNTSLMSGFEESVPATSNSLQDMVDTLMPDSEKHEAASSTVPNHTKSDIRSKLVHSEHREFKPWPVPFRIPTHLFRPELKATLASKQILSRKMKSALIQAIYDEMINYTVYPTSSQYKEVAMAIITEYSHLRDNIPGSKGYESWSATLSDKFRNERRIMTNIEVVEKRKRRRVVTEPESSSGDPSDKSITIPSSYRQTQTRMSSQLQRTNQLRKKKPGDRTRITPDNNNNGMTTKQTNGNIAPSCLGVRAKRRRISSTKIGQTDSRDSLLVVYDRKAKEVIGVKEETINITYSDKKETINNSRKKNFDNTNNNKCHSSSSSSSTTTTSCSDPNQTVYGDDRTDIVEVDTKNNYNNDSQRREISNRGEKNYGGSLQFKSVKKLSTIKSLSSTTTAASKNKKDQQNKVENSQISSSTIKTSSRKRIFSAGSIQLATTTQRPTPPRQTTHRERKWNNKWKRDFPWLERGVNHNGREVGMCLLCQSAGKKNSFANDGSTNLQYSAFLRHQTNREHRQAVLEKQILKQGTTNTADCSDVTLHMEQESNSSSSNKRIQPIKQEVIEDDKFSLPSSSTPSSSLFYLTKQPNPAPPLPPTSMVQSVYPSPSSYQPQQQQQHLPIVFPSYSTDCINDRLSKRTQPSRVVTPFYDDGDDNQKTSPQRVFLLSKKAPPLQLSGDLLILQVSFHLNPLNMITKIKMNVLKKLVSDKTGLANFGPAAYIMKGPLI